MAGRDTAAITSRKVFIVSVDSCRFYGLRGEQSDSEKESSLHEISATSKENAEDIIREHVIPYPCACTYVVCMYIDITSKLKRMYVCLDTYIPYICIHY